MKVIKDCVETRLLSACSAPCEAKSKYHPLEMGFWSKGPRVWAMSELGSLQH